MCYVAKASAKALLKHVLNGAGRVALAKTPLTLAKALARQLFVIISV
jgi:hypothetical protein